ncbi:MAG TPA: aspartyl/asparaginyl beta-hydroxylase domain-containing protein [Vitreimonas sp.]|nr:aspartyl/asparaginyl beta-hydroxylase domain-containing protein [Vitreimonas sp.]
MYANPRKTESVRQLGAVDVAALRDAVLAIPEATWAAENSAKPNRFDALDETRHIVFRFVSSFADWRDARNNERLWNEWAPLLEPVLAKATEPYGYADGSYPRVMLARMAPGGVIHPHRDANPAAKWPHKIHVPLTTNDKVSFFVAGVPYQFKVGDAVEVNNMAVHAVKNEGDTDRIHLIFEYYDRAQPEPEWLPEVLARARARQGAVS